MPVKKGAGVDAKAKATARKDAKSAKQAVVVESLGPPPKSKNPEHYTKIADILNEMRNHEVFSAAFDTDKLKIADGAREAFC